MKLLVTGHLGYIGTKLVPLLLDRGPSVRQPELGPLVATVGHEGQPLAVGHLAVRHFMAAQEGAVARPLGIEGEAVVRAANFHDPLTATRKGQWLGGRPERRNELSISRLQWVRRMRLMFLG